MRWQVAPVHLRRICQTLAASDGVHLEERGCIPVDRVGHSDVEVNQLYSAGDAGCRTVCRPDCEDELQEMVFLGNRNLVFEELLGSAHHVGCYWDSEQAVGQGWQSSYCWGC